MVIQAIPVVDRRHIHHQLAAGWDILRGYVVDLIILLECFEVWRFVGGGGVVVCGDGWNWEGVVVCGVVSGVV